MAEMTSFQYGGFYDVPRCIALRYRERLLLLQSYFDEDLDEYPSNYKVYVLPESVENPLRADSRLFPCIGEIQISAVVFDSTKREELDAHCLDGLLAEYEQRTK
jgi:hypothetical protein